jgi:hypothetical protein
VIARPELDGVLRPRRAGRGGEPARGRGGNRRGWRAGPRR